MGGGTAAIGLAVSTAGLRSTSSRTSRTAVAASTLRGVPFYVVFGALLLPETVTVSI
jgi:hypothetical protein